MTPNSTTYCWTPSDRGGDIAEAKGYRLALVIQYDGRTHLFLYCTVVPRKEGTLTEGHFDERMNTLEATDNGRAVLEDWKQYALDHPGRNVALFVRREVLASA